MNNLGGMRASLQSLLLVLLLSFFPLSLLAQIAALPNPPLVNSPGPSAAEAVDLRPTFERLGLVPRQQGARPTCSVFTIAGALEFAVAKRQGHTPRLSVEFLNWAADKVRGDTADGGFFSDLWNGFASYGICSDSDMPYDLTRDPKRIPGAAALADAKIQLSLELRMHWIKEWNVNTGLTE